MARHRPVPQPAQKGQGTHFSNEPTVLKGQSLSLKIFRIMMSFVSPSLSPLYCWPPQMGEVDNQYFVSLLVHAIFIFPKEFHQRRQDRLSLELRRIWTSTQNLHCRRSPATRKRAKSTEVATAPEITVDQHWSKCLRKMRMTSR